MSLKGGLPAFVKIVVSVLARLLILGLLKTLVTKDKWKNCCVQFDRGSAHDTALTRKQGYQYVLTLEFLEMVKSKIEKAGKREGWSSFLSLLKKEEASTFKCPPALPLSTSSII